MTTLFDGGSLPLVVEDNKQDLTQKAQVACEVVALFVEEEEEEEEDNISCRSLPSADWATAISRFSSSGGGGGILAGHVLKVD